MASNFNVDFIGIGAYKSGTTWLVQCLREHPDVCIPHIKEIEFFCHKFKDGKFVYSNYDKGLNWYKKQFRECDDHASCWGEFSNAYLYDENAPRLIKKAFPNVKLLLCLRNPVDRMYSGFLWEELNFNRKKYKGFSLEKIIGSKHVEQSMYGKYVKNYLKLFKRDDICVMLYDDIVEKPEKVIANVYRFLELKSFSSPSLNKIINPAAQARSSLLTYFFDLRLKLEEKRLGFIIDFLKRINLYTPIQNWYVAINRKPINKKPLTEKQRHKLKELFIDDIRKTEKLLKIDLSIWK